MQLNEADQFFRDGWCQFGFDPALAEWVGHALPAARDCVSDPAHAQWLRYGGTWFAGVNALPNDAAGRLSGGPVLAGAAIDFIHRELAGTDFNWDRAQVSVCYPGYPQLWGDFEPGLSAVDALFNLGPGTAELLR